MRVGRPLLEDCDLIVPVLLHRGRLWLRRYNQLAELARRIGIGRSMAGVGAAEHRHRA